MMDDETQHTFTDRSKVYCKTFKIPNDYFMHRMRRGFITSKMEIDDIDDEHDFSFVDLRERDFIYEDPKYLSNDKYLYRPVPLVTRTWVYHSIIGCESSGITKEVRRMKRSLCGGELQAAPTRRDFLLQALR